MKNLYIFRLFTVPKPTVLGEITVSRNRNCKQMYDILFVKTISHSSMVPKQFIVEHCRTASGVCKRSVWNSWKYKMK